MTGHFTFDMTDLLAYLNVPTQKRIAVMNKMHQTWIHNLHEYWQDRSTLVHELQDQPNYLIIANTNHKRKSTPQEQQNQPQNKRTKCNAPSDSDSQQSTMNSTFETSTHKHHQHVPKRKPQCSSQR